MAADACGEAKELQRAAVMFPRFFLWLIGLGLFAVASLGGTVVAQNKIALDENKVKIEKHVGEMGDHEARLRLLEQSQKDLKETARDTREDVREIRRLIEGQARRDSSSSRRLMP